ncbi:MAG: diaminopimelate epimerase [Gammaproteobacteria bacterium]
MKAQLHFTKMHGLGNDFMVLDGINQSVKLTPALIQCWADRHTGIGFDQLLLVEPARDAHSDFFYRIFNADGQEVGQCGNGARCLARFVRLKNLTTKPKLVITTATSRMLLHIHADESVTVDMGMPQFAPEKIPLATPQQQEYYELMLGANAVRFTALSIGNPHAVIILPDNVNIAQAPVADVGSALAQHDFFPESVNVGFMKIIDRQHVQLRVYERGVGETLACGSGACAAVVAGIQQGLLQQEVFVSLSRGDLVVQWQPAKTVLLTGEAVVVFEGSLVLSMSS